METVGYILIITAGIYIITKVFSPKIVEKKPKHGVFGAQLMYADQKQNQLLVSEKYDLQGKPDYIFQTILTRNYIPVELKSTQLKEDEHWPHEGDLMQLAAYFLIIEDIYRKRPKQGRLIYKNRMFIIKNTRSLRKQVLRYMNEMRQMLRNGKGEAEPSFPKCRNCVCSGTVCEWYEGGRSNERR